MTELGKYEILEETGRGGFAVVYKAWDTTLDRVVALKLLAPHLSWEPEFVKQFHREAKSVARLRHTHIVVVHEIGEEDDKLYIAMEYLQGYTLAEMLTEKRPLPLEQVVIILEQLADALDYAHDQGVLHRDIKPGNIMVERGEQGKFHATLMDFGLVKAVEDSRYVRSSGRIVGTPEYMSPEQAEGEELDHRSDLYSLGVVAYHMCTGQAPFTAPSPLAVLRGHTDKEPSPPRELNPHLSAGVEQVLQKALAKKREERYQSAGEMAQALRRAVEATERARAGCGRLRRIEDRSMVAWGLGAAGLVILAVLLGLGMSMGLWLPQTISAPTEAYTREPTEVPAEVPEKVFKVGMVTEINGIDDKSFNAISWHGLELAEEELGAEVAYLESQQQTDYRVNITQFLDQDYDLVVTVSFLLADDTETFAQQNPDANFAIVDFSYDPPIENVLGLTFAADEAAFLAGYLAAGMTKTGKVGTFGAIEIPPVTILMVGFQGGVDYYNRQNETSVEVLGMDVFIGNFESTDDGRRVGENLIAEGADIIMPVAGPAGLGTAAAIQENPGTMLIGYDTDWCVSAAEYCDVQLTSVVKNMDVAVLEAIRRAKEGTFEGGVYVGTLENNGVSLAPFNEFDDDVPNDLKTQVEEVRQRIIDGTIEIGW